jgi:hypothetical protein
MRVQIGQTLKLVDAQRRSIGSVGVERYDNEVLMGTFTPGPGFPAVAHLFQEFEEAAANQALRAVDKLDAAIAALGLTLLWGDDGRLLQVCDVQIWSDGGFSCRPCPNRAA